MLELKIVVLLISLSGISVMAEDLFNQKRVYKLDIIDQPVLFHVRNNLKVRMQDYL